MPDFRKTFRGTPDTFDALYAAERWLRNHGITFRPPRGRAPVKLVVGLSVGELDAQDGLMTFGEPGPRGGAVTIVLAAEAAARAGIQGAAA